MANFISNGGCSNGARVARDGAGAGARNWQAAADIDITGWLLSWRMIFATMWDSDDMNSIDGDFQLQWRNVTDAGSFADLTATGEVKWATDTDLVNDNAVVSDERGGVENCTGMGVSHLDGYEIEGASAKDLIGITSDSVFDMQFAVDMSGGDLGDEYEFRVVETGTSNSYGTYAGTVKIVENTGDIVGVTKDNGGSALASCKYAVFKVTDEGPPEVYEYKGNGTSDGSGNYSFTVYWDGSTPNYMVYAEKDDTPNVMDATDNVVQPV
jgi:hypothetical protein